MHTFLSVHFLLMFRKYLLVFAGFTIYNTIMKTTITKRQWKAIYRLLNRVSPINADCGILCGSACCTVSGDYSDEMMGIYLYPGEEKIHDSDCGWLTWTVEKAEDYDFPDSWSGNIYFVRCKTPPFCPRNMRPFQCRTFPLAPHITEEGVLTLIYNDETLPYRCPLIDEKTPLNDDFIKATYTVWSHLIRDPLILDLVEAESCERQRRSKKHEKTKLTLKP